MPTLGPLVPADETLHHQITDTFATVAQSDRSWTEKVCAMAALKDGSLGLAFGMGKYLNRGVLDAYAGVSIGKHQWTVRSSRKLAPDVERTETGPIRYEILEPLNAVRFSLAPNDVLPISFEWTFIGAVPCALENREHHRSRDGLRLDADIVRYHQIGTGSGWAEVDGTRYELTDDTAVSTRDHSWGVRYQVGLPLEDVEDAPRPSSVSTTVIWSPILMERPDGTRYGMHTYYQRHGIGGWQRIELQGGIEHPDGRREPFAALVPTAVVDDGNRRLSSATFQATMTDGSARPITVTALGDTGFHLGAGLYFGFDGHFHGEWRGDLHVDGEHIADCTDVETAHRLHQIRDNLVRVEDPVGGGVGIGNLQSIFAGPSEEMGLSEELLLMGLAVQRDVDDLRSGLERWLGRPVGEITRPDPGYSCETLIVERDLVVRLPPIADAIFPTYDLAQQTAVQDAVGAAGVPVAGPARYEPDTDFLGTPFVAMPFVAGPIPIEFTPIDPWLTGLPDDSDRRTVWTSFLETLVAIHRTPIDALGLRTGLRAELAYWSDYLDWSCDGSPPANLRAALDWCVGACPAEVPTSGAVWGDVRLGNVVYDDASRTPKAVLDWDMVSAGPAETDLAWFLALEGVQTDLTHMTVPGFGTRDDAIVLVERGIGRPLQDLPWHEVFALVRASAVSTRIGVLFQRAGQRSMFKIGQDPTLIEATKRIESWAPR